jgi:hypothetical protein
MITCTFTVKHSMACRLLCSGYQNISICMGKDIVSTCKTASIKFQCPVSKITRHCKDEADGVHYEVEYADNGVVTLLRARHVVVAMPPPLW